jgi:chromosome segregation ATPase
MGKKLQKARKALQNLERELKPLQKSIGKESPKVKTARLALQGLKDYKNKIEQKSAHLLAARSVLHSLQERLQVDENEMQRAMHDLGILESAAMGNERKALQTFEGHLLRLKNSIGKESAKVKNARLALPPLEKQLKSLKKRTSKLENVKEDLKANDITWKDHVTTFAAMAKKIKGELMAPKVKDEKAKDELKAPEEKDDVAGKINDELEAFQEEKKRIRGIERELGYDVSLTLKELQRADILHDKKECVIPIGAGEWKTWLERCHRDDPSQKAGRTINLCSKLSKIMFDDGEKELCTKMYLFEPALSHLSYTHLVEQIGEVSIFQAGVPVRPLQ